MGPRMTSLPRSLETQHHYDEQQATELRTSAIGRGQAQLWAIASGLVTSALLASCTGQAGGASSLVDIVPANNEVCDNGGHVVRTGRDDDGDGRLSEGEVGQEATLCNGVAGPSGAPSRLRSSDVAPGEPCAAGGVRFAAGVDADGDGTLSEAEVDSTAFICHGVPGDAGKTSLVAATSIAPGGPCATGGLRIDSGLDDDADGLLDPGEIDRTEHVCHGASGPRMIAEIVSEAPGARCLAGGQRFRFGRDTDADGALDDAEVEEEEVVCSPAANLVSLAPQAAGTSTACPSGGTRIDSGLDTDRDGQLSAAEVSERAYVCNGPAGGRNSLVAVNAEPAGTNCVAGGRSIASGVDIDGDGVLDPNEVSARSYVCHGTAGAAGTAVSVSDEPPGPSCPNGGVRIDSGPDSNGNGALEAGEVTTSTYVCDGAAGTLIAQAAEPVGPNCPGGGVRLETGPDTNGNGALEASEVTSTRYVCNGQTSVPFYVANTALTAALLGSPYTATLEGVGGVGGQYTWSIVGGALPDGLSLDPQGTPYSAIHGIPTAVGRFTFTVQIADRSGATTTRDLAVDVEDTLRILTFGLPPLPQLTPGLGYGATLRAGGGAAGAYTWSIVRGALPAGLTLQSAGGPTAAITGQPLTEVGARFTIEVEDSSGAKAQAGLRIGGHQRWVAYTLQEPQAASGNSRSDLYVADVRVQPLSPVRIHPTGTIAAGDSAGAYEVSPTGAHLAYTHRSDQRSDKIFLVDLSGSAPGASVQVSPPAPAGEYLDAYRFHWSPDGRWLVMTVTGDVGTTAYVVDVLAASPAPVAVSPLLATFDDYLIQLVWSADSSALALTVPSQDSASGVVGPQLYVWRSAMPVALAELLVQAPARSGTGVAVHGWTAASDAVVIQADLERSLSRSEPQLYYVDVAGGAPVRIDGEARDGAQITQLELSEDGARLFYLQDLRIASMFEALVVDLAAGRPSAPRIVSGAPRGPGHAVSSAVWSPDGRHLLLAGDLHTDNVQELFVADTASTAVSGPIRVSADLILGGNVSSTTWWFDVTAGYAWSPNGDRIFYRADQDRNGVHELWSVSLTAPRIATRVNDSVAPVSHVGQWRLSEAGDRVLFVADVDAPGDGTVFVADVTAATPSTARLTPTLAGSTVNDLVLLRDSSAAVFLADIAEVGRFEPWFVDLSGAAPGTPTAIHPGITVGETCYQLLLGP